MSLPRLLSAGLLGCQPEAISRLVDESNPQVYPRLGDVVSPLTPFGLAIPPIWRNNDIGYFALQLIYDCRLPK
jgi:hypothetical protein